MAKIQVLLLRTSGTNCEMELAYGFQLAGAATRIAHFNELVRGAVQLKDFQILAFPGGFSYGDDIAAGRLHALEIRSYLKESLTEFVQQGKLILGICNGFQVLVNAHLLPAGDLGSAKQDLSLAANKSNKFECRWVYLKGSSKKCVWFPQDRIICIPIAHGEGRLVPRDDGLLADLKQHDQIAFRYTDAKGDSGPYPVNPNGSVDDIAGVCDPSGRILGMMPHPERYLQPEASPAWTRCRHGSGSDGLEIISNGVSFIEKEY
ncbi:phosphoribosylformylglycinamidine synthase I [Planctomycetota bacterium]